MKFIRKALPHLLIALLFGLATITVLNEFNPAMGFLTSSVSKTYIFITCFIGLVVAFSDAYKS